MKRWLIACGIMLCALCVRGEAALAGSAVVTFRAEKADWKVGEEFVVVASFVGTSAVKSIEANLSYDAKKMTFLSGGKYVSGGEGSLKIQTGALEGEELTRKFSLTFKAKAAGEGVVSASGKASIIDGEGSSMSVSSNRLSLTIGEGNQDTGTFEESQATEEPEATEEPLSDNNHLLALRIHTGTLKPAFGPKKTSYKATVDNETVNLFFSFQTADEDATVTIAGNEGMKEGNNKVKVVVRAPDGSKKTYQINVKRETAAETEERTAEQNKGGESLLTFHVYEEEGRVFLENAYRFEVVDVEEASLVPVGFVKDEVRFYGINITAYTMENDPNNDILLIYALNETGDKNFYQYDRLEKTMQRYTGDLIEKVNKNVTSSKQKTADEYNARLNQLAIIIAIVSAICVLLLIVMIKMVIKMRGVADYDDLNLG